MANHQILTFAASAGDVIDHGAIDHDAIVGQSRLLSEALERVRRVAPTDAPVLITGETGTGKELLARAIHRRSRRSARPIVSVSLAAVPETLAAAELFGHERGAFTGADRLRIGRFEAADRGTLFLDEVGELRTDVQAMLLRALQEGEIDRLGGTTRRVDVRLIAATNRDLSAEVQAGRFREDLFYRLNVFPVPVPPLRDRRDDIPSLAEYFLQCAAARLGRSFSGIEPASLCRLQNYRWPGNIRQLQNVVERCAILCDGGLLVVPEDAITGGSRPVATDNVGNVFDEQLTLEEIKKRYIAHLLASTHGNMVRAAAILNVDRRSLYRMVARYRLGAPAQHRTSL